MPRRALSQPESEGVNTDGGEVRPRADGQAEKPIRDSKRESGGWAWAGSDLPAEQANGQVVVGRRGGLVGRGGGGKEGGW